MGGKSCPSMDRIDDADVVGCETVLDVAAVGAGRLNREMKVWPAHCTVAVTEGGCINLFCRSRIPLLIISKVASVANNFVWISLAVFCWAANLHPPPAKN